MEEYGTVSIVSSDQVLPEDPQKQEKELLILKKMANATNQEPLQMVVLIEGGIPPFLSFIALLLPTLETCCLKQWY